MAVATLSGLDAMWQEVLGLANAQYTSREFSKLMAVPLTMERARHWAIQIAHFTANRRDCWGYVQGAAPLDVKKLIWAHEEEELIGEPSSGKLDHYALTIKEGEVYGLTPADFERTPAIDGGRACFYAWTYLARDRPWLEAFAASVILEVRNSAEFIKGGAAMSAHRAEKLAAELGIPVKKQVNNAEHMVADIEHAHLLMQVAQKYAQDELSQQAILHGARESLALDRVFWAHLADMMLQLP